MKKEKKRNCNALYLVATAGRENYVVLDGGKHFKSHCFRRATHRRAATISSSTTSSLLFALENSDSKAKIFSHSILKQLITAERRGTVSTREEYIDRLYVPHFNETMTQIFRLKYRYLLSAA